MSLLILSKGNGLNKVKKNKSLGIEKMALTKWKKSVLEYLTVTLVL